MTDKPMPDEMWFLEHPTMGMLASKYKIGDAVSYTRTDLCAKEGGEG